VSELARLARTLEGALSNSFPDLVVSAAEVERFVGWGGARRGMVTEYGDQFEVVGGGTHDPMYGMLSPEFRNAVTHLRVHIDRARRQLDTTVNLLAQFAKLQARVEPFLADLVVEPAPVRAALRPIPPTPRSLLSAENKSTGMNEWCPIASMREPEPVDDGILLPGRARRRRTRAVRWHGDCCISCTWDIRRRAGARSGWTRTR